MAEPVVASRAVLFEFLRHQQNTNFLIDRAVDEKLAPGSSKVLPLPPQVRMRMASIRRAPDSIELRSELLSVNRQVFVNHELTPTQYYQEIDGQLPNMLGTEIVEKVYNEIDRNLYRDNARLIHELAKTNPGEYVLNPGCGKLELNTLLEAQARLSEMSKELNAANMLWAFSPYGRGSLISLVGFELLKPEASARLGPADIGQALGTPVMITHNLSTLPEIDTSTGNEVVRTRPPGSENEPAGFRVFEANAWAVADNRMTIEMERDHYILPGEIVTLTVPRTSGSGAPLVPSFTEPARVLESHDDRIVIEHTRQNSSRAEITGFVTVHSTVNFLFNPRLIRASRQLIPQVKMIEQSDSPNTAIHVLTMYGVKILPGASVAVLSNARQI